ncbi:MAG TPA: methylenetetrahydrofolate--tRNA-(uracil(54)-C(5))-methyltransferase (FADH(2)-oxidizing) TrmFO [Anaerolineales bacterium]|nr:methylenetetrahydrofolate--tRNA-(uracil(54)-C(5))-methyltransferase (FADH(2)-oxidizing) TrmFO [Anaerolineales bacterium]
MTKLSPAIVIGGGLAGTEAAWQLARAGIRVSLYEMRPSLTTGAHQTANLAELVCSNSLGSNLPDRASGVLKNELRRLGSLLLDCAEKSAVPAGSSLAVDRERFSALVTDQLLAHPNVQLIREEVLGIPPESAIIASGPLTSPKLSSAIASLTGEDQLYFYDAIAPVVAADSVDMEIAFRASRYGTGDQEEGDYLNCPFNKDQYETFVDALLSAERIALRDFESGIEQGVYAGDGHFFEGCLPVEIIARRGRRALAFGPMRPTGLTDPHTGRWPYALVQLRQDNLAGNLYNLVGFQTNLTYPEQKRVLRMIPGLGQAEFVRYGQMHRNTFLASPKLLEPSLQFRGRPDLFFAGQLTGVEGYMGNIATGLLAGVNLARQLQGKPSLTLPATTMLGALCHYITHADLKDFQPMKSNFGILPPLETGQRMGKRDRAKVFAERARADLESYLAKNLVD